MASRRLHRLGAGIALSLMSQTSSGMHIPEGIKAYETENFETAYTIFSSHADRTNPRALYYLSLLYLSGKGVEQNEFKAFKFCRMAAEEGMPEAQFQLGVMYLDGVGVMEEDEIKALEWLWKAADSGHQHANELFDFILNRDFPIGC